MWYSVQNSPSPGPVLHKCLPQNVGLCHPVASEKRHAFPRLLRDGQERHPLKFSSIIICVSRRVTTTIAWKGVLLCQFTTKAETCSGLNVLITYGSIYTLLKGTSLSTLWFYLYTSTHEIQSSESSKVTKRDRVYRY